eukprot:4746226-Pyramimonas_sp.AAC.1
MEPPSKKSRVVGARLPASARAAARLAGEAEPSDNVARHRMRQELVAATDLWTQVGDLVSEETIPLDNG